MVQHGKHRPLVRGHFLSATLCSVLCASTAYGADARPERCRLALLLSMDVSSSVDTEEYDLQQSGLAAALLSEDVQSAILRGSGGHVTLGVYEWSGRNQQTVVLDWMALRSQDDLRRAARRILSHQRGYSKYPTSMGHALLYAEAMLQSGPKCARQVIDVSGDGINNDGFGPRRAKLRDITVNGLVVEGDDPGTRWFYETEVIRGPHAFVEIAKGYADFERAMTLKLFREISNIATSSVQSQPLGDQS